MLAPKIETAVAADIPALARLRSEQSWQPSPRLLGAIEAWSGGCIFLIRESSLAPTPTPVPNPSSTSAPIATVSAIAAGPAGVIGNVIVRAEYRKRGLGRLIMEAALGWLRERGARHVLLAATPDGRPLYTHLGFVTLAPSWFAHGPVAALDHALLKARADGLRAQAIPAEALSACAALDASAFGGDRMGLLELLLRASETWLYSVRDEGSERAASGLADGYLILRRLHSRRETLQIGPWVANSPAAAAALLASAVDDSAPWRAGFAAGDEPHILAGVDRRDALTLLVAAGATLVEDDVVMQLDFTLGLPGSIAGTGGPPQPIAEHPEWLYAWLAPMVF